MALWRQIPLHCFSLCLVLKWRHERVLVTRLEYIQDCQFPFLLVLKHVSPRMASSTAEPHALKVAKPHGPSIRTRSFCIQCTNDHQNTYTLYSTLANLWLTKGKANSHYRVPPVLEPLVSRLIATYVALQQIPQLNKLGGKETNGENINYSLVL